MKELEQLYQEYFTKDEEYWIDEDSGDKYLDYFHIDSESKRLAEIATNEFVSRLEVLIINNQDDFDRGKGVTILENFIKELR